MSRKIFIAGTDTGVGKTYVGTQLLHTFTQAGYSTLGLKPIASGCKFMNGQLVNDDAFALASASSVKVDYATTNPFAFEPAIAPHIAAQAIGQTLTIKMLTEKMQPAFATAADVTIIEGAGGWLLPLNEEESLSDFVLAQKFEIILVVGMRLGCLNHALLTERVIRQAGGNLIGWIANCPSTNMHYLHENITTLTNKLHAPRLATTHYASKIQYAMSA